MTHCGVSYTEWTFENCWLSPRDAQFSGGEDFSESFNERIRDGCTGSQAGGGKTISAQQIFEALHGWNNRCKIGGEGETLGIRACLSRPSC